MTDFEYKYLKGMLESALYSAKASNDVRREAGMPESDYWRGRADAYEAAIAMLEHATLNFPTER